MKNIGTSEPEQAIFYYVKRYFPDAQNRYHFYADELMNRGVEIDIFIPSLDIAIEYDGKYWHDNKVKSDTQKNTFLNQHGLYVIRIRDLECPALPDFYGKIFYHGKAPKGMHTNECIECLIHELSVYCSDKILADELAGFSLPFEEYIKDSADIISTLYPYEVEDNKSQFCGAECWDTQTNGRLSLKNIPANDRSTIYANFICKAGKTIRTSINFLQNRKECKVTCNECARNFCLLIERCNEQCPILYNYLLDYLNGQISLPARVLDNIGYKIHHASWLMELFKQRLTTNDDEWIDRFDKLHLSLANHDIIKSISDFEFAKEYFEKCGVIIDFDVMAFDQSEEHIKAVADYFLTIYNKLVELKQNDKTFPYFGRYSNFVHFLYCKWERNKSIMSKELQTVVIAFIKQLEEKMIVNLIEARHKFD